MLELGTHVANEMMLYEGSIDELRALAIFLSENNTPQHQYLFEFIRHHSIAYAQDIHTFLKVRPETVAQLTKEAQFIRQSIGLTSDHVAAAHRRQLCARGGFWEMRRYFGQIPDVVDSIAQYHPDHLVCATLSGSVLGEYIAYDLEKRHELTLPVDHTVFSRLGAQPLQGHLPLSFSASGDKVLIIEDVVQESRTTRTTLAAIQALHPSVIPSLFALEIDFTPAAQEALTYFDTVFTFEQE